jgi:signal transduction histidine kinase
MRLAAEFFEDEEQAQSLKAEIMEMEKIVVSLLEAERLNSRHAQLSRTDVNVGELVKTMLDDFFSRDMERISVSLPDEPVLASIDAARISLLLKNLLSNALRYTRPDEGLVEVTVAAADDTLVLTVADNGPGLSEDQAAHIGEPFYRGDPSRARESGGSGLGLYLATLVAKAHGGTLRLLDSQGQGACFEVRIPLMES